MEADRGWCSAAFVADIRSGEVDDTDVSGTTVALAADFPSGFLAGNGRLYFDPDTPPEQRRALEQVFSGRQGGIFELFSTLISEMLPARKLPSTSRRAKTRRG